MWTTVLLSLVAFAPAQADSFSLTNVRTTYGVLGAARPDNKILPGDDVVLSFDIEGIKPGANGKAQYSIGMEVTDNRGRVLYRQAPTDQEAPLAAGAAKLPAVARVHVGLDQEPGDYTLKVKVTDRSAGTKQEVSRDYTVLRKAFGIVRPSVTKDAQGRLPVGTLQKRKSAWINFSAVGFERNRAGQPNVVTEMQVRDANGKALLARPTVGEIKQDVPERLGHLAMQFELELNRPGQYTLELKATDKVARQTATLSLPVTVQ
jgi:hypothetical protein